MSMVDARQGRRAITVAQLFLVVAAGALWAASRLPWVVIRSFDELGPAKQITLPGALWSTALLPLAVLMLITAVAAVAVRGWPLRILAVSLAAASFVVGYLGISLWVISDVAARGADLAQVSVATLVGSQRHYAGAVMVAVAGACALLAAVLLLRSASPLGPRREATTKYAAPALPRSAAHHLASHQRAPQMSERMIWDALDEGHDPTERMPRSEIEGR